MYDVVNQKPLKPCSKIGCHNLTQKRYCEQHENEYRNQNRYYDKYQRNKKHDRFYHSAAWKKAIEIIKIRDKGLCQRCLNDKRLVVGTVVDHIIPLSVEWNKRLDENNLQLLCVGCHNKKTKEDLKKYGKS